MKKLLTLSFLLLCIAIQAQPNTEVYLTDITEVDGKTALINLRNISNNEGYDNQPSFYTDSTLVFASTRNGQTDIAHYDIAKDTISWVTNTPAGSEYSPLRIPNSTAISAIRLDTSGLQRLYRYDVSTGEAIIIREDEKVGYHLWYSEDILVYTILVENRMDLVVLNFKDEVRYVAQENVGRSLHKIPNSDELYYIGKETDMVVLKSLHPVTKVTKPITSLPSEVNDICILQDGRILFPYDKSIFSFDPLKKEKPQTLHQFQEEEINSISRMSVSSNGKYLALVSEESPARIVQKQVDSYNAGNLDAFVNCYAENVVVRKFPNDTLYVGHEKMRKNYQGLSPEKKTFDVVVVKRIIIGNTVIDHEKVTGNGKIQMQVAIYEIVNNTISSMTFIFDDTKAANPETIVQLQLNAYNERAIDKFLLTYTEDIEVYDFPSEMRSQGQQQMREGFTSFFEATPDLHCKIKNRIVIGNKVIDEEYITANGTNFSAVAIYEVEKGKITKVTFVK